MAATSQAAHIGTCWVRASARKCRCGSIHESGTVSAYTAPSAVDLRSFMSWAAVLAIGVVLASEGAAGADEATARRLEYRAPVSCPDEAALVSRIRARVDMRLARLGETVPTFDVTVQTDGGRVVGRIASMSERGEPTWREVSGSDCSDVVDAVALIVAMALSPETSGNAPAHAGAGAGANASAGATAGSFAPSTTGATTDVTVASGNPPASPARETPTVNSESKPRIKLLGSGQAEVTLGYWPSALVAAGARLQVFRTRAYASGPSMAIGFAAAQPVDRDLSMGQSMAHAHLALTTGELRPRPGRTA